MTLTEADRKVLSWMVRIRYATPADIGTMMGGTVSGKAQGLGRMGGRPSGFVRWGSSRIAVPCAAAFRLIVSLRLV
jgi:hypothetical protein